MITIDGSTGEGGGQVLRTSLALSAITGQPVRLERIRAGRRKPGLQPQHLTAVQAAAKLCAAHVDGAKLDSLALTFSPRSPARAGNYVFDVAQAAKGGSAGSVSLVLQTVLLPMVIAAGRSSITVRGGTHVAWSPPFDFLKRVYLPTLARLGIQAKAHIEKWGWYPMGGGEIQATVDGPGDRGSGPAGTPGDAHEPAAPAEYGKGGFFSPQWTGLDLRQRGALLRVRGLSASSNLPKHIRTRQEQAALQMLRANGINARIDIVDAPSKGQGTAVFLWAESENAVAGFTALGERGKPAERVAEEAVQDLLEYLHGGAALDRHLADQLVLPLALAGSPSHLTTQEVTRHLLTNAWVANQFLPGCVQVEGQEGQPGTCQIGRGTS